MKNSKKAVTPVIATIILIAATIVLALVVGAYTFGLFGSNVKTVTLTSGTLYGGVSACSVCTTKVTGTSSLSFSLNNPGSATVITSVTITGAGITAIDTWALNSGNTTQVAFASPMNGNAMLPGAVTPFTYYPTSNPSQSITTGQTFNYVINFQNGQSVSGALIAQ